jgi:hypothetical protein
MWSPQIQRLREAVSVVLARAAAAAQDGGREAARVEAGCEWLEEYCIFVQGRFREEYGAGPFSEEYVRYYSARASGQT